MGKIVKKHRTKGVNLIYYAYGVTQKTTLDLEKGKTDPQISTLWKLSEALELSFDKFIGEVLKELPEDFSMLEEN